MGILYAGPGRPVVIAACTRDFETVRDAERLMAGEGRAVWKAVSPALESADERAPPSP